MPFAYRLIPAAAAAALLASCGGGGASDPPPLPPPVATRGVAVDGYLVGSTVLCDSNGNGVADAGELSAGTDANGRFEFRNGCDAGVVVRGGASKDTGLSFTGVLTAPAGATVASPLTTLLSDGLGAARLLETLGLDAGIDLLNTDPATGTVGERPNIALLKATLAMQQLLQKTSELLAGLGGASGMATLQAVYVEVAAAFAAELGSGGALVAAGVVDPAVVSRLVAAASARVRDAGTVGSSIPAALANLNMESVGSLVAGAMAAQASALLAATDAGLTDATAQQQSDIRITSFAVANRDALAGPPDATTAALAAEIAAIVAGIEPPTDFLALTGDAIELVSGSTRQTLTIAQFQSPDGASVRWPVASDATLSVGLTEVGSYALPSDMKLTAAISITDNADGGQGEIQAFIDDVRVEKTAGGLKVTVPATSKAQVYGVSADGRKKAVIDFSGSVAGVTNTLRTAAGSRNSIVFGEVVDFAINRFAEDFTGIRTLRGAYSVSVVISGLPLRQADGTALPAVTVTVPTAIDAQGAVTASRSVAGPGLVGTLRLTD